MPAVKISSKIEDKIWRDLKSFAGDTHQSVSGLLTEAVSEFLGAAPGASGGPGAI